MDEFVDNLKYFFLIYFYFLNFLNWQKNAFNVTLISIMTINEVLNILFGHCTYLLYVYFTIVHECTAVEGSHGNGTSRDLFKLPDHNVDKKERS
jgi:hypothetical protein